MNLKERSKRKHIEEDQKERDEKQDQTATRLKVLLDKCVTKIGELCSEHIENYLEILKNSFPDLFYTSTQGNVLLLNAIARYETGGGGGAGAGAGAGAGGGGGAGEQEEKASKDPMMSICAQEHQQAKLNPNNPLARMPSLLKALVLKYSSLPVISEHVEGNFYIVKKMHPANLFVNRVRQLKLKRNLPELIELNVLSSSAVNLSNAYKNKLSSSTEFFRLTQRVKLRKKINTYALNFDGNIDDDNNDEDDDVGNNEHDSDSDRNTDSDSDSDSDSNNPDDDDDKSNNGNNIFMIIIFNNNNNN